MNPTLQPVTQQPVTQQAVTQQPVSRRKILQLGAVGAASAIGGGQLIARLDHRFPPPARVPEQVSAALPEIQFDIGSFIAPVQTIEGVEFRFGPTYTQFLPARLTRPPTLDDQAALADALDTIESTYAFTPRGVFTFVSYGIPYFRSLPRSLVAANIPRLDDEPDRFAFEEAQPSPTDVVDANPDIRKARFHVPMRIETNDLLFTIRSDDLRVTRDVMSWLRGSNRLDGRTVASPDLDTLLEFDASRLMFAQPGRPRQLADAAGLPYATRVHPDSPMWMGFADQQVAGSGPADIATFQGNDSASLTSTKRDDYFFNGGVQHLSHVILDLEQWYLDERGANAETEQGEGQSKEAEGDNDETFLERVQYMFRSTPPPSEGFADQLTDGGGPAYLPNDFDDAGDAERSARGIGTAENEHRIGHLSALQRSSRATDGTPMHIRVDGPGYDAMDVPDRSPQPKLQFSIFVPTAKFFADMRRNQASTDLCRRHEVSDDDNGLERFITTTRRQNYLVPPRRHRAFPLLELLDGSDDFSRP